MRLLKQLKSLKYVAVAVATLLLIACDPAMQKTQQDLNLDAAQSQDLYQQTHKVLDKQSLVEHKNDYYVAQNSFEIEQDILLPAVFEERLLYSSSVQESLPEILNEIYGQTGVKFKFTPDALAYIGGGSGSSSTRVGAELAQEEVEIGASEVGANIGVLSDVKLNLQYAGTLSELITRMVTRFNIYWEFDDKTNTVVFYRTKTKNFALDVLPGISSFNNTISSSSTISESGDSGVNLNSGSIMTVNYKNEEGNTWDDTVNTVENMLTREGKVTSNPRSGYVTVTDVPGVLAKVEDYINKVNDLARKKVAVKVDVFDVRLSASTDYGINWDAVLDTLGGAWNFNTGNITSPLGTTISDTIKVTYTDSGIIDTGSLIFRALSQQADTTQVIGTTVYTVNGEPAPVQVVDRQDYIKEVTFGAVSDQSSTTEVAYTPGTIITGFFMVVTPKILSDSQILLNISVSLSSLTELQSITVGTTDDDQQTQIQLPKVQSKNFMESVTLNPGQSVILSGFQDVDNRVGVASVARPSLWPLGGAKGTDQKRTILVTVVTPYVIGR
jgi:type IVB pilus formation R64 PilN family outer membrane protein